MHVGPYECTFPITGKNESKIDFKSIFFLLSEQCFVPTMCIFKERNIIYHIQLI